MARRIRELLAEQATGDFVGRAAELALLRRMLEAGAEPVWFLYGIGGIGKSRLIRAFGDEARQRGATVYQIDCQEVEPTPRALLRALAGMTALPEAAADRLEAVADALGAAGSPVLLVLDDLDAFRLIESWLRTDLIPALPDTVRVLIAGRTPPGAAWLTAPGWSALIRTVPLGPLSESDAIALLAAAGIGPAEAAELNRTVRGHPLALRMIASAPGRLPAASLRADTLAGVVEELSRRFLAEATDPLTRRALEAAAVVRRVTRPLLAEMLPADDPAEAWDRLAALSFVQPATDGLALHDAVQDAIAAHLRAADPERHHALRHAAWRHLRAPARVSGEMNLWRQTADLLFLVENPSVRGGCFPTGTLPRHAVDAARPEDGPMIARIARRAGGPEWSDATIGWWERAWRTFWVLRNPVGDIAGFSILFAADELGPELSREHPILQSWLRHLRRAPLAGAQRALFGPCWIVDEAEEGRETARAALWLNAKRLYMEMRPRLRRAYVALPDPLQRPSALSTFGFRSLPEADVTLDGRSYRTLLLDFGPGSVDGWLSGLVAAELGVGQGSLLDIAARELVVDGARIALTRLEFEVARYLSLREGQAVSRTDLLADVWGTDYDGGSNVVDVVIRGLRRKLGERATVIEAVRGTGYRWRAD